VPLPRRDATRCALAGALLLALSGCGNNADRTAAERLIRAYDRAVIEAHLTANFGELEKVTSKDELERVQIIVGGLRAQKQMLIASLESLKVESASFDAEKKVGVAIATERWTYQRADSSTREAAGEPVRREYKLRYELVQRDNDWVVERVRHEESSQEWRP
jgi:hypothetical protein